MRRNQLAAIIVLIGCVWSAMPEAQAQNGSQRTRQQEDAVLKELRAIRALLERGVPAPAAPARPVRPQTARFVDVTGPALGSDEAPLTLIEFTDLQCPFCRQHATSTFLELKERWIDTGKLRYISRDLPLAFHAHAMNAARAARCGGEQGKFWEVRMALVRNGHQLSPEYIAKTAADLGLDTAAFANCVGSTKYDEAIRNDSAQAQQAGITGTPTFVIGRTASTGIEGPMIVGVAPYESFNAKLTALLEAPRK
jgi:protein-disulfide isomerase